MLINFYHSLKLYGNESVQHSTRSFSSVLFVSFTLVWKPNPPVRLVLCMHLRARAYAVSTGEGDGGCGCAINCQTAMFVAASPQ